MTYTENAATSQTGEHVPSAGADIIVSDHMAPDLRAALEFLDAIGPGETSFTFFTVDDNKGRSTPHLRRHYHGTLAQHAAALEVANRDGAGVFVTVNETDLMGRKAENIRRIRAVWHDHDNPNAPPPDFTEPPLLIVSTSPGKFHSYWPVAHGGTLTHGEHRAIEEALVCRFGSDPNCKDVARVMRLPGFRHMKDPAAPYPVHIVINLVQFVGGTDADALRRAFTPNGVPVKPELPSRPIGEVDIDRLKSALERIDPTDRETWLSVGMALHLEFDGSAEGFEIWDDWALRAPDKYDEAGQEKAWRSFKGEGRNPVTLGTVFHLARQYGWQDPDLLNAFSKVTAPPADVVPLRCTGVSSRFVPISLSFQEAARIPQRSWLIPNMLQRGELSLLVAPGSAGKSLWALHLAAAVALGGLRRNGLDALGVDVRTPSRVLFLGYEDPIDELQRRTVAFCTQHGVDPAMLDANLRGFDVSKGRVMIAERYGRSERRIGPGYRDIVEAVKAGGYDFVVVDPLVKFHSLNENDNGDMNFVCDLLRDMARETNAALLTTHHTGKLKNGPESIAGDADAGRGASSMRDAVRILLTMSPIDTRTAGLHSVPETERWEYFRVDTGKINYGPRPVGAKWFRKVSAGIPNGEIAPAVLPVSFDASQEVVRLRREVLAFIREAGDGGVAANPRGNKGLGAVFSRKFGNDKAAVEMAADHLRKVNFICQEARSEKDRTLVWRIAPGQEKWTGEVEVG